MAEQFHVIQDVVNAILLHQVLAQNASHHTSFWPLKISARCVALDVYFVKIKPIAYLAHQATAWMQEYVLPVEEIVDNAYLLMQQFAPAANSVFPLLITLALGNVFKVAQTVIAPTVAFAFNAVEDILSKQMENVLNVWAHALEIAILEML